MKTYNQSALSAKGRRVIFEEAKKGGVIIQRKSTSGEVLDEFVMISFDRKSPSDFIFKAETLFDDVYEPIRLEMKGNT